MARSTWSLIASVLLVLVMVLSALAVVANSPSVATPSVPVTVSETVTPAASSNTPASAAAGTAASAASVSPASGEPTQVGSSTSQALSVNSAQAAQVEADQQQFLASGGTLSEFHPPNLHPALPLTETHGLISPIESGAPAPMGLAYYGLNNTDGTVQGTSLNSTSVVGTWQTTDPLGTQSELFTSGSHTDSFGSQLNVVLVNVTLQGDTTEYNPADSNAPNGCPTWSGYNALPGNVCPNEFWLQNYIGYTPASGALSMSNEIWNFSNEHYAYSSTSATHTLVGFGSGSGEYQGPSAGSFPALFSPFTVVLYVNYTQGPCHLDTTPGTGVPSCGLVSTTYPVNEIFMNYTVLNSLGQRVCPTSIPAGRVCGEADDIFFNSVAPGGTSGVPLYGPNHRIGSATIQANGTAYNPTGLPNDYEFDYGIGTGGGSRSPDVYQNGTIGLYYCPNANTLPSGPGAFECSKYSAPPAAWDAGSDTGESSTGEAAYWAPSSVSGYHNSALVLGSSTPVAHLVTGPSNQVGLWNMTGSPCVGVNPSCPYVGDEPLSIANIAPANAWIGIARDLSPGVEVTNQSYFQVAPTFGWFSSWGGSGGVSAAHPTELGQNLYLPTGWYTIEVELSGYTPVIQQIDLTSAMAPSITLIPNWSTGAYTPDWAFSNADLANLSVSPSNTVPNGAGTSVSPYIISAPAPTVGAPFGVPGSVSWLFSGVDNYAFPVWIGAFTNSTTAVTQFNPAPSFQVQYPSWQETLLTTFLTRNTAPFTNGLQYNLYDTQNLAVIGATDISVWASSSATSEYSFIVNNGANDLIADNTFHVSEEGIDLTGGGTTSDSRTINGATVFPVLGNALNVVWGNTFIPDPQSILNSSGLEAFSSTNTLTVAESYDRVYNNAFTAYGVAIGAPVPEGPTIPTGYQNASANAGATDTNFWNATCQAGYAPLSSPSYPAATVCEPLSYSQSLDGYTMTGSILPGATFQGGNYWSAYGNLANPYANIPYKAHTTSVTTPAAGEIAATGAGFAGDYAPLLDPVYHVQFTETGLTSSATTTAFEVTVANSAGYTVLNETGTSATPASCSVVVCLNFDFPNGTYTWTALTSLSGLAPSPAIGTFTVSGGAVSPIAITWSAGSVVTFTETGLHTGVTWYVNITGQRSISSVATTATITLSNALYIFTYATGGNVGACYTGGSGSVTVSGVTGEPVAFTAGNYCVLFAESGIPAGLTWQVTLASTPESIITTAGTNYIGFLESNGGPYAYTIAPTLNTGSGLARTGMEQVSEGFAESAIPLTGTVTVNGTSVTETTAAYTAFEVWPQAESNPIDVGQSTWLGVLSTPFLIAESGGTAPFTEVWTGLPDGCTSATVASTGVCTPTDNLGSPYTIGLTYTDSHGNIVKGSVVLIVDPALSAGTAHATANPIDVGQTTTIETTGLTGGDGQYWYSWSGLPSGVPNGCGVGVVGDTVVTGSSAASFSCTPTVAGTYTVVLTVTDGNGGVATDSFTLTVNGAVTAPVIAVSPMAIHAGQSATLSITTGPSGGNAPYTCEWLVSTNGGSSWSDFASSDCSSSVSTGALTTGTYEYELQATDSSNATVDSNVVSVTVAPTYSVTFKESGLPSGLTWTVTVNGTPMSLTTNGGTDSLVFQEPNGTYAYAITDISGWHETGTHYSGTVTVAGAPKTFSMVYTQVTYSVTFKESGLPSGLNWTVTLNGTPMSLITNGATDSLVFHEANGTLPYSITGISGWHQATLPYTGSVVVNGAAVTEPTLKYKLVTYSVTFKESGLPSGLNWTVTVDSHTLYLTTTGGTDSLVFTGLANGTYAYSVTGNAGWHQTALPYSGSVTVSGASVVEPTLKYKQVTYLVTFSESGIRAGLTWRVTVNGHTLSLTTNGGTDSVTFSEANGTYSYSISSPNGWVQSTLPTSGTVTVNGASVNEPTCVYTKV
jgi:hypothetical protein